MSDQMFCDCGEPVYPTMPDQFCCACDFNFDAVPPLHPGYAGEGRLTHAVSMPAGGASLYHCLVAASNVDAYRDLTVLERRIRAEALHTAAIKYLDEEGDVSSARRLELSGMDGYPEEQYFRCIAMSSGISFEVEQPGIEHIPHYGNGPIAARLLCRRVADGAGHQSCHYDLQQIYRDHRLGNGRWRLLKKTPPRYAVYGLPDQVPQRCRSMVDDAYVKIGDLPKHHLTIEDAISKHPAKRARALSVVLRDDYALIVKWKVLQTYMLRNHLWPFRRPTAAPAMASSSALSDVRPVAASSMPSSGSSDVSSDADDDDASEVGPMWLF